MQASLLERIDHTVRRFGALSNAINRMADRMTTRVTAKACHPSGSLYCGSTCGAYCYSGTNPYGQKICYYREIIRYGYGGCSQTCYDACDCYKVVSGTSSCPTSCTGCTWA